MLDTIEDLIYISGNLKVSHVINIEEDFYNRANTGIYTFKLLHFVFFFATHSELKNKIRYIIIKKYFFFATAVANYLKCFEDSEN